MQICLRRLEKNGLLKISMLNSTKNCDVLVVDYGVGNHQSICNALNRLGYSYIVSSDKTSLKEAPAYILPGVGAFKEAMKNLIQRDIVEALREEVKGGKPLLGICLGMQVLAEDSIEGGFTKGLGFIPGHVVEVPHENVRVPHVGWNDFSVHKADPLFSTVQKGSRFYFDHSYHFETEKQYRAATTHYGTEIVAAVQHNNIYGVQFHPEKSQNNGLRVLRAFIKATKK